MKKRNQISVLTTKEIQAAVKALAKAESRSVAQMAHILISEALAARKYR